MMLGRVSIFEAPVASCGEACLDVQEHKKGMNKKIKNIFMFQVFVNQWQSNAGDVVGSTPMFSLFFIVGFSDQPNEKSFQNCFCHQSGPIFRL